MSKSCIKYKCPNRITIGKESDNDVVNIICPKCEQLLYVSDKRTNSVKKRIKHFSLFVFTTIILGVGYYFKAEIKGLMLPNKSAEITLNNFFDNLNDMQYHEAFNLTENAAWYPYQTFKKKLSIWNNIELKSIKGKSYYSKYEADTILNAKYLAVVNNTIQELDFDFHMKKFNDNWRIIRLYFPRNPDFDALRKEEIPKDAKDAINTYFDLISKGLCKKSYLLSTYKHEEKHIEQCNCIEYVTILNIDKIAGKDIYNVKYKIKNNCSNTTKRVNRIIEMKKTDYWRLDKIY